MFHNSVKTLIKADKEFKKAMIYMQEVRIKRNRSSGNVADMINKATQIILVKLRQGIPGENYSEISLKEAYTAEKEYLKIFGEE